MEVPAMQGKCQYAASTEQLKKYAVNRSYILDKAVKEHKESGWTLEKTPTGIGFVKK